MKRKIQILGVALFLMLSFNTFSQNVGINSDGTSPNNSAMLDVKSPNKGLLIPQIALTGVNDGSTIATPAVSLLIYNTATVSGLTPGYYYNAGTTVVPVWTKFTTNTHYLGEEYLGGIIFYLYTDNAGTQKGFVVSKTESTAIWQNTSVLENANITWNGLYNMNLMTDSPSRAWVETLGSGWYLPSIDELSLLWHNRFHVNSSPASELTLLSNGNLYWSSTEENSSHAYCFSFGNGQVNDLDKTWTFSVRGVKAF